MLEILTNITQGKGKEGDIELLEEMAAIIKDCIALRSGSDGAEPGPQHHPLFPGGI